MKIFNIFFPKEVDPTCGSVFKNTIQITQPLWYMTVFWIAVYLLNLYWVSRLGETAISAVAIGGVILMAIMLPVQGIVTAVIALAGSFDREDKAGLDKLVKQILTVAFLSSALLAVIGYFAAPFLTQILGASSEVTSLATTYLRICAISGVISFLFLPINNLIRATRDVFHPMILVSLVLFLQGAFDYLLIAGNFGFPKMGVAGAGLSFGISMAIGTVVGFLMLVSGKLFIKVDMKKWRDFRAGLAIIKEIIKIAGFNVAEGLAKNVAGMIMLAVIVSFGTPVLAAFTIGQRFFGYATMFSMDMGATAAITIANNLGARDIKRAEKSTWIISGMNAALLGVIGLVCFIFAPQIVSIFSKDREVSAIAISFFRITTLFGLSSALLAVSFILQKAFAGAKDTRTPMVIYFIVMIIQLGLAVILPKFLGLGIQGVWIAILIGMVLHGLVLSVLFKLGHWKPKTT